MEDGIELIMRLLTALLEAIGKAEDAIRSGATEDKDQAINRAVPSPLGSVCAVQHGVAELC